MVSRPILTMAVSIRIRILVLDQSRSRSRCQKQWNWIWTRRQEESKFETMVFGLPNNDDGICRLLLRRLTPAPFRDFLVLTPSIHYRILDNDGIAVLVGQNCHPYLTESPLLSHLRAESIEDDRIAAFDQSTTRILDNGVDAAAGSCWCSPLVHRSCCRCPVWLQNRRR